MEKKSLALQIVKKENEHERARKKNPVAKSKQIKKAGYKIPCVMKIL